MSYCQLPINSIIDDPVPNISITNGQIIGPLPKPILVVSYGMGVDSTAMLVGLHQNRIKPNAILFADVGNEFLYTYAYLGVISIWLEKVDFPPVTVIKYTPKRFKHHRYSTLAGNCLANRTLPSLAFGRKSCSLKWKGEPLDKKVSELFGKNGCYRAIGYDCSLADNKRFAHATQKGNTGTSGRPQDYFIYPLQLWGWTRDDCKKAISEAELPVPGKSSCDICPSVKKDEVDQFSPEQLCRIVIIEANASVTLRTVKGLWRKERITDYIRLKSFLPASVIDYLWNRWSAKERIVTNKNTLAEDVLEQEVYAALSNIAPSVQIKKPKKKPAEAAPVNQPTLF